MPDRELLLQKVDRNLILNNVLTRVTLLVVVVIVLCIAGYDAWVTNSNERLSRSNHQLLTDRIAPDESKIASQTSSISDLKAQLDEANRRIAVESAELEHLAQELQRTGGPTTTIVTFPPVRSAPTPTPGATTTTTRPAPTTTTTTTRPAPCTTVPVLRSCA